MAYDHKEGEGSLFKNDNKQKGTDRDYQGSGRFEGKEVWLSGWINEKKDGSGKYLKITMKPKDAAQRPGSITEQALAKVRKPDPISSGRSLHGDMNDDIPFAPEWR
jgi:hypothetical protein